MTILTGTRCTIFTKLPVAFSGGKAVNFDPDPMLHAVDMASQVELGIGVHVDLDALAGPQPIKLVLLEIGGHPDFRRNDRENLLARRDVVAHFHIALGDPAILRRPDDRPGEIEIRLIKLRLSLLDLTLQLVDLSIGLADMLRHRELS